MEEVCIAMNAAGRCRTLGGALEVAMSHGRSLAIFTVITLLTGVLYSAVSVPAGPAALSFPDACGDRGLSTAGGSLFLPAVFHSASRFTAPLPPERGPRLHSRLPADPQTVAPPLDESVSTDFADATAFIYEGPDPIQRGVAARAIDRLRVAVLRGRVTAGNGAPLPGVRIRIYDRGEYGETLSRADGIFDMAVNGGGQLTVCYEKAGYLPLHRKVQTLWRDYAWLPDVTLLPFDPQVTTIDLTSAAPVQVAQGSPISDADGARRSTLLFFEGTTAEMVLPSGSVQALSLLSVRATEYTVGERGPQAMPGELPASSGYTYAVEFSIDEALAAGAVDVRFNQPVINYLENFLDFPVGTSVPVGSYDRAESRWVPEANGRVVKILSLRNGLAQLDVEGSGLPSGAAALVALGIGDAERRELASIYEEGQSLWRVPITHFTPWDHNWPYGPPPDADPPDQPEPSPESPEPDPCEQRGSIIECQNQVWGERIPVVGTPFTLNYRSNRVPGHKVPRSMEIALSGDTVPASLARIELQIAVAGQRLDETFPALPNQTYSFAWDGTDAYGRPLIGEQPIAVRIGYVYPAEYKEPAEFEQSFAGFGGATFTGNMARQEVTVWQQWVGAVARWSAVGQGLGGWTLSTHHRYDPGGQVLQLGDGRQRRADRLPRIITTAAGNGTMGSGGDGGLATAASLTRPEAVAVAPDGALYIADWGTRTIRRVASDGTISTVAGDGANCVYRAPTRCGDGGPATTASLNHPADVVAGADGALFIADPGHRVVRRVSPSGIISTVAGNGEQCNVNAGCGDGGPATAATLASPVDVALAPDGSLFIADAGAMQVRKVGTDGTITTVAGNGLGCNFLFGDCGDGGPAIDAPLYATKAVEVGPDGSLYIAHGTIVNCCGGGRVRRVSPDGTIDTYSGGGQAGQADGGDGGPALEAYFHDILDLAVGPEGTVYVVDENRIRSILPDQRVIAVAGTGAVGAVEDGTAALQATFNLPLGLALAPDGDLFIAERDSHRVREVRSLLPGHGSELILSSEDGSRLFQFDFSGRHLQTIHALTGAMLYMFSYHEDGRLSAVEDGDGNVTTIESDGDGGPTAIVSPYGQRTALAVNGDGYLASVTNPAGESHTFTYHGSEGLLAAHVDPRGNTTLVNYDGVGRLIGEDTAVGSNRALARTVATGVYSVTLTSDEGTATVYRVDELPGGDWRRLILHPEGTQTEYLVGRDGDRILAYADGTHYSAQSGPDSRWGMQAPLPTLVTLSTPGGRTQTREQRQAVRLVDEFDLLSLETLTETLIVNGNTYTTVYASEAGTVRATSPEGREILSGVDGQGRPTELRMGPIQPIQYIFDSRGRLVNVVQGSGAGRRVRSVQYNTQGYVATFTNPLQRQTAFGYDGAGRLSTITRADGQTIEFSYDASGNLTTLTPPQRPAHHFTYTGDDLVATYVPPDVGAGSNSTTYSYDGDRRLTTIGRPDGGNIVFDYDDAGRLATTTIPRGTFSRAYESTTGQLASASAPGGITNSYEYDGFLLTHISCSGPVAGDVGYSYDDDFRVASTSVNGTQTVAFQYDRDGLLVGAGDLALSWADQTAQLASTTLQNVADSRGYDDFGELASYVALANNSALFSAQYGRDKLGRIMTMTEVVDGVVTTFEFGYDPAGRLTTVRQNGATAASYAYDGNGNRLSATTAGGTVGGTYDAQDRLLQYGTATYTYTANGELFTKSDGAQTTTYSYDALGNLTAVALPDGTQIDYLVDAHNRRIGRRVDGTLVQGYLYLDEERPVAELDGAGNVISRFVYGERSNVPAYMIRAGQLYRIIADHLGSPRLVVNAASGQIVQQMNYDAYGRVTMDSNPGFQPFGFAGGLYDPDTGLVRFGARDYDAETGRWTAKDPSGFLGGATNLYAYVDSDPVNATDPTGLVLPAAAPLLWFFAGEAATSTLITGGIVGAGFLGFIAINEVTTDVDIPIPFPIPEVDPDEIPTDPRMPSPWDKPPFGGSLDPNKGIPINRPSPLPGTGTKNVAPGLFPPDRSGADPDPCAKGPV